MSQKSVEKEIMLTRPVACAYIRYSDLKQEGKNSSVVQLSEIQNAVERNGHYLPEKFIFIDKHVSAFHKKAAQRPALNDTKETVKNNIEIKYIYFYDFSRLDRTVYSFVEEFYYDLKQYRPNIQIFLCSTNSIFVPEDPRTKLEFILASYESAKKARVITDTNINFLKYMKRPGSRTPYGYDMYEKKLYQNNDAIIVIWIFFLYSWGYSMNKIAQVLNTDNIPPPKGIKWRSNTVEQILSNEIYIGRLKWEFRSRVIKKYEFDAVENPIVPPFLYSLVKLTKQLKSKIERYDTPFLLADLIECSSCRARLVTRNNSTKKYKYRHYQCPNCDYYIEVDSIHPYIRTDVSNHLKEQLEHIHQDAHSFILECEHSIQEALLSKQENLNRVQSNLSFIKEKPERLSVELEQVIQNAIRSLEKEIAQLEIDLRNVQHLNNEEHLSFYFSQFASLDLSSLTAAEQRFITVLFLERVSVLNANEDYRIYFKKYPFEL